MIVVALLLHPADVTTRTRLISPYAGWQHERRTYLRNEGEECLAYLTYLRDMYHVLPDAVLFFQGDGVVSAPQAHLHCTTARSRCTSCSALYCTPNLHDVATCARTHAHSSGGRAQLRVEGSKVRRDAARGARRRRPLVERLPLS